MNRPLLITIGITILLLMIGLWVYLIAYGAPQKPREVFTNLGFLSPSETEVRVIDPYTEENPGVQLSLGGSQLQQLTTRAVAGFAFVPGGNTLRYIERGTGYGYEIDLISGTETQISLTTIPQTAEAVFSPDTKTVAITVYEDYKKVTVVGTFTEEQTLQLAQLPEGADNIAFEDEQTLYFTLEENGTTVGYAYDVPSLARTLLLELPFTSAVMLWGSTVDGTFAYTKPSPLNESGIYAVASNSLTAVGNGGYGLVGIANMDDIFVSSIVKDVYSAAAYIDGVAYAQGLIMVPEKCAFLPISTETVLCAAPLYIPETTYLENWYKGSMTSTDHLWTIEPYAQKATHIADFTELGGRTIDVDGMTSNVNGELLLLRNKLDGALWLYRVTQ